MKPYDDPELNIEEISTSKTIEERISDSIKKISELENLIEDSGTQEEKDRLEKMKEQFRSLKKEQDFLLGTPIHNSKNREILRATTNEVARKNKTENEAKQKDSNEELLAA